MNRNLFTDDPLVKQRLENKLPVIDLAGNRYVVDLEARALKATNNLAHNIDLDSLVLDKEGLNYLCFYHLHTRSTVIIGADITSLPPNTVYLRIPDERFLDPIGLARQYGMEDTALLSLYPIRSELKAEVIAIEDSGLPELIRINLEKKRDRTNRIEIVCKLFKGIGRRGRKV